MLKLYSDNKKGEIQVEESLLKGAKKTKLEKLSHEEATSLTPSSHRIVLTSINSNKQATETPTATKMGIVSRSKVILRFCTTS